MTLNGVMAIILRYFAEFDSFWAYYVKVVEDTSTVDTLWINSPFALLLSRYTAS